LRLSVRCLEITSIERSHSEMLRVGVDPAGIRIMAPKHFHYNLKVESLTPAQANIIKQDMLSIGGEVAVARGVASCSVRQTDAIISGTLKELNILIEKLKVQNLGLPEIALTLRSALDNVRLKEFILKGRGKDWTLGPRTLIMGILNVTPDSFSDGGRFFEKNMAVERALEMVEEGADWIDIGGESTRPGALPVALDEELKRVVPVVEALSGKADISVDTTKSEVARLALQAGAEIINDVSALGADPDMAGVCAEYGAPVVLMHMRGTPATMQKDVGYNDLMSEVFNYLSERIDYAESRGIGREKIMIDPGLGFGKSREGNLEILGRLKEFRSLGRPVLIGASRKSFIAGTIGKEGREIGTIAAVVASILNGANAVRVHDVSGALHAVRMADALRDAGEETGEPPV
jgi:dihydropteroate synthase